MLEPRKIDLLKTIFKYSKRKKVIMENENVKTDLDDANEALK